MILTLITLGKMLEARSKGKTTDALKSLMKLAPKTATLERDGKEVTVPAEQIVIGDIFLVRPGESIPADGVVIEGRSAVNESALTGESVPADKEVRRQRICRNSKPVGLYQVSCRKGRRGHCPFTDNQNGKRCRCHKSAYRKGCGQGLGNFRSCGYFHCSSNYSGLAAGGSDSRLCTGKGYFRAGNQLPLCAGSGNSRCYHGGQWNGRKERHTFQDCRFSGADQER